MADCRYRRLTCDYAPGVNEGIRMKFESDKTGQHLREQYLAQDASQRMKTIQALSAAYLSDSRAIVSGLLLSALGGCLPVNAAEDKHARMEEGVSGLQSSTATMAVKQVTESMQPSANDESYEQEQASRVYTGGGSI